MSTNPTPSTLRACWSRADLLCMLQQRDWPSPPLCLKDGHAEVRRVWLIDKAGKGKACIEKHYTRKLSANQQREVEFLAKCSRNNLLKARIACLVKTEASGTMQSEVFHTEWGGLDLQQWHTLLGASNPLTNSIPGLLFLIKKILEACHEFRRLGLVHNDLHCANLILDYDYDPQQHSITLKPDQIRLIDFEFSLRPRADQSALNALNGQAVWRDLQIEPRTATEWRQADGNLILLAPNLHSPHVCAAVCEMALSKRCMILHRRYRRGADGTLQYLPEVFMNLEKVDFGVDFFTLGQSLKHMIRKATRYWDDAHTRQWEEAHDFLLGLPALLQNWDQELPQQVRAVPHQELMSAIQAQLGSWNVDGKLTVWLPGGPLMARAPAAKALDALKHMLVRVAGDVKMAIKPDAIPQQESAGFVAAPLPGVRYGVSYAWNSKNDALVDQLCAAAQQRGIHILRDKTTLGIGDKITPFMQKLGAQDKVFVILSEKYLQSPFCMFELFEIWRNCRHQPEAFLSVVRVFRIDQVDIFSPKARLKWAIYWNKEHSELDAMLKGATTSLMGAEDYKNFKSMQEFAQHTGDILQLVADTLLPQDFAQLIESGLG